MLVSKEKEIAAFEIEEPATHSFRAYWEAGSESSTARTGPIMLGAKSVFVQWGQLKAFEALGAVKLSGEGIAKSALVVGKFGYASPALALWMLLFGPDTAAPLWFVYGFAGTSGAVISYLVARTCFGLCAVKWPGCFSCWQDCEQCGPCKRRCCHPSDSVQVDKKFHPDLKEV
mmetsp:Transcript_48350/g.105253  ORF Transcript_48350/g.105253 Transcript_48350/m.105253 type:complete len:173 (-) Transcript_48350:246-764(-)